MFYFADYRKTQKLSICCCSTGIVALSLFSICLASVLVMNSNLKPNLYLGFLLGACVSGPIAVILIVSSFINRVILQDPAKVRKKQQQAKIFSQNPISITEPAQTSTPIEAASVSSILKKGKVQHQGACELRSEESSQIGGYTFKENLQAELGMMPKSITRNVARSSNVTFATSFEEPLSRSLTGICDNSKPVSSQCTTSYINVPTTSKTSASERNASSREINHSFLSPPCLSRTANSGNLTIDAAENQDQATSHYLVSESSFKQDLSDLRFIDDTDSEESTSS